jgi:hypothetical protein
MMSLPVLARRLLWIACCVAFAPGSALGATILEAARHTHIIAAYVGPFGEPYWETITDVDPLGFGYWSSSLYAGTDPASASQFSLIDPQMLAGSGGVWSSSVNNYAETRYHVVFSLGTDTPYSFAVDNVDAGYENLDFTSGFVTLRRVDPGDFGVVLETIHSVTLGRSSFTFEGLPDFAADGLLGSGTYAFDFRLVAPDSHFVAAPASAGFLLFVPEPGTFLLVSAGLTLLVLAGSRREHGQPHRRHPRGRTR